MFKDSAGNVTGELGLTLRALGRITEADALLEESHDILLAAYGEAHQLTKQVLARVRSGQRGARSAFTSE